MAKKVMVEMRFMFALGGMLVVRPGVGWLDEEVEAGACRNGDNFAVAFDLGFEAAEVAVGDGVDSISRKVAKALGALVSEEVACGVLSGARRG